jgi:FKBP-type peptidyl-prolyl cis-trans isomerase
MKIFLLGIFIILLLGVVGFVMSLNKSPEEETNNQPEQQEETMAPSELQIEDIVVGEGKEATAGKLAVVHYTGTLTDGTKFDSSVDRGTPFQFVLGAGNVIQGWDQGVLGMKVGGKRKLTIPPELGYGAGGVPGTIPPNSTLVFEVELLDVKE